MQQMQWGGDKENTMNWISDTVLLILFTITAYQDWKEQNICLYMPIAAGVVGLILHLLFWERTMIDLLLGVVIGVGVLLIAWVSRECVGAGDGIMLMISGIYLGFWGNLELLLTALLLVGIAALFLIVVKRKGKNYRVPFLPFVLVAYLIQLI